MSIGEGTLLWQPSATQQEHTNLHRYMRWLHHTRNLQFGDYHRLWRWSVDEVEAFWASLWDYFEIKSSTPYSTVLAGRTMPGARWFEGATINYAEHVLGNASEDRPAIMFRSETEPLAEISWNELAQHVASIAAALRGMGVTHGDRVVAYVPNIPQAVVAFLACASIGAIWSSCSPDFGTSSVVDRFQQIEPTVLIAVDGYRYNGKAFDRRAAVRELQDALPTLQHTVLIPYLDGNATTDDLQNAVLWPALLQQPAELTFEHVPFDHPLWILYSSGTTGLPKPIVQGHGGMLLEHLKALTFHSDIRPGDRFFWFTTTGWMMWNYLVGGLLVGATIVLYDGSPGFPDLNVLWQFAEETKITLFGTSAPYLIHCMKAGITPEQTYDLRALRSLGSTGSPLPPEGFAWVYERIKRDLWLASISGGTDLCTAFVGGCPLLPVHAGELQCRALGANVHAFDETGRSVVDQVGELVITAPMPSMPLFFWNDGDGTRYHNSYFDMYPGVWRHGDWIKITPRGSAVIYGRSDSTINRQGVRMGTSEFYRVVEALPPIRDSLVIDLEGLGRESYMALFVVLHPGVALNDALRAAIKQQIRTALSPRHVPDDIVQIAEVPRTINGKKLEVPVKKILLGTPLDKAANPGSMANGQALQFFVEWAARRQA